MSLEGINIIVQIGAFASAAIFFIYKIGAGYFVPNISVTPTVYRIKGAIARSDVLKIVLKLSKGDSGSVNIHDAQARVVWSKSEEIIQFSGIERLSFTSEKIVIIPRRFWFQRDKQLSIKRLNWRLRSRTKPFIRIGPHEETYFSCLCNVPTDELCTIEIAVLGKRPKTWLISQWKASLVSVPGDA